ncbi:MAG: orotidine-5'-phosphate decarboxylase [Gammaproteobacteria bacterium]|nr:orotidine-5'-phosphate decarboxylase [Gammaproteobacteria bacterium]
MSASTASSPVITALDFPRADQALDIARKVDPELTHLKVGKELFTRAGPSLLDSLHKLGFQVFLDLKFHDIPNTVAGACRAAVDAGVWMVNVHAAGGVAMLEAARTAVTSSDTRLIAVTVLTSMSDDDLAAIGVSSTVDEQVLRLAHLTRECGLDGVVCSPRESTALRQSLGADFLLVTPGVRPENAELGDQQRVLTPKAAMDAGSDYLVIGRPITQAADPLLALQRICATLSVSTSGAIA